MRTKSQHDRFRRVTLTDPHGRKWTGRQEIQTGVPVDVAPLFAPLRLGNGAVVLPPAPYLQFYVEEPGRMTIAYDVWEADVREAERRWGDRLLEVAKAMYADGWIEAAQNPSRVLLEAVGPKPVIPLTLVRACAAGNPWALGLDPKVPTWGKEFMAIPERLLMAERKAFPTFDEEVAMGLVTDELAGAASAVSLDDLAGDFTVPESGKPRGGRRA